MARAWESEFSKRMRSFEALHATRREEIAVSLKVRVTSGCFHREHSPRAYGLIDKHLASASRDRREFAFVEHESGPELLVLAALLGLTKEVIGLVVAIIRARREGVKNGDQPSDPIELIVRRIDDRDIVREETVLRIGHRDAVDQAQVEALLNAAIARLAGKTGSMNAPEESGDAQIRALVQRIRQETGRAVPDVDPDGPGAEARVLVVLRDPGAAGALKTGYLSPTKNNDRTAMNQRRLMREAGLAEDICLFWNAVPWDLRGANPRAADKAMGAGYLNDLLQLLRQRRAVVACGNVAHDVCDLAGVEVFKVCHPSDRGLGGGKKGARPQREADYRAKLEQAASLAAS